MTAFSGGIKGLMNYKEGFPQGTLGIMAIVVSHYFLKCVLYLDSVSDCLNMHSSPTILAWKLFLASSHEKTVNIILRKQYPPSAHVACAHYWVFGGRPRHRMLLGQALPFPANCMSHRAAALQRSSSLSFILQAVLCSLVSTFSVPSLHLVTH